MAPFSVAIVGVGKIAVDQHLPVIAGNPDFRLAGLVSGRGVERPGVPTVRTLADLIRTVPGLDAVSICTPPSAHYAAVREALDAGVNVLLEKPPTATVAELVAFLDTTASDGDEDARAGMARRAEQVGIGAR